MILQDFCIAVKLIGLPRRKNDGAAPLRGVPEVCAVTVRVDKGNIFWSNAWNEAICKLRIFYIVALLSKTADSFSRLMDAVVG